nr:hypothetical protein OH826_00335 [Streptomyces sp. NBC_00899]WSX81478.1 hypothetical protein OH826_51160 [Streptomyces sp. NBC_00899]
MRRHCEITEAAGAVHRLGALSTVRVTTGTAAAHRATRPAMSWPRPPRSARRRTWPGVVWVSRLDLHRAPP